MTNVAPVIFTTDLKSRFSTFPTCLELQEVLEFLSKSKDVGDVQNVDFKSVVTITVVAFVI